MALTREQIKTAALDLDPAEREALAEELLLSIDGAQRDAIDAAWLDEARRRDQAFAAGKTQAHPVEQVIERLRKEAASPMIASILQEAESDLEHAFDYYEARRAGLGLELVEEFRHAVDYILEFPNAWQKLDDTYRRHRLRRFPYGIVYRVESNPARILIVAIMHLSRKPDWWRERVE